MVMAAAIAATRADGPVRTTSPHAVEKSYPDFFEQYKRVGGSADELDVGE
jgi:3-phosphoshikimate 1-carboxyvinyltransferase